MACMSTNEEITRRNYVDSLQLTNWILYSGATCHKTLDNSSFILVSLVETDKYIEVVDEHFVIAKQTGSVQIKCMTTMENPPLLGFVTRYWNQTCAIEYFPFLC